MQYIREAGGMPAFAGLLEVGLADSVTLKLFQACCQLCIDTVNRQVGIGRSLGPPLSPCVG